MMQTKAKEAPDDTMGSGAMGIATTEVDGGWVGVPQLSEFISQTAKLWVSASIFYFYMLLLPFPAQFHSKL